ncbi:MAG: chlorophyllase/cutinase-like alpha/beta fold protein [Planctomycetota bacterium]
MARSAVAGALWFAVLLATFTLMSGTSHSARAATWTFVRGDLNGNGALELADPVGLLTYLFIAGASQPACFDAADVNDDGQLGLSDAVQLLAYLYVPGTPAPLAPFPICGADPTSDALDCQGPLAACPEVPVPLDLAVAFSSDVLEEFVGVRCHPLPTTISAANFAELRFALRPVTLAAGSGAGTVTLSTTGDSILQLFTSDGVAIALPTSFGSAALPVDLLLGATEPGDAALIANAALSGEMDVVAVHVSLFPGLAGGELATYPHFEYVQSINSNDELQVALDPTRYGERAGLDYRVYVVAHRTPAEWAVDNALVDVSGGFELATLTTAGGIENNVTDAWTVALDGGVEVGAAYDVVCDFGLDGALDPGDLIDGLSYDEAGCFIVKDLNTAGPHAVSSVQYSGGSFLGQKTYYPSDIASLGELPIVVISHGNGHNYTWYDYLGNHLASHGYVVMSHQNNTGPGIETASTTTLTNTDYFLGNLATVGGGVLNGHVDAARIVWIGHSRGGEGVVRAYDRVVDGAFVPVNFVAADIVCISSIAPTVFNNVGDSNPHAVSYHLLYGAADGDVAGGPTNSWPFRIYQAATGTAQATYVQGAGHNDFNCCGFLDATGPALIGRPAAQVLAKSYYLALVELYTRANPAARDYFDRNYDSFRPSGIAANVIVANQYRHAASAPQSVIENYQTSTGTSVSSSGGAVVFDVDNVVEDKLQDNDGTYAWLTTDPMNLMTQAKDSFDLSRGVVFDWPLGGASFYEIEVVSAQQDFRDDVFLRWRAAQGSRHPETVGLAGEVDFTVTLRDGFGVTSSINFASFASVTRPYQRTGSGTGAGWGNEFCSVRCRVADFEANGSGIDLSQVVAVRFEFGDAFGSARGRLSLDDVYLSAD